VIYIVQSGQHAHHMEISHVNHLNPSDANIFKLKVFTKQLCSSIYHYLSKITIDTVEQKVTPTVARHHHQAGEDSEANIALNMEQAGVFINLRNVAFFVKKFFTKKIFKIFETKENVFFDNIITFIFRF